jgi:replicative DNA helicase
MTDPIVTEKIVLGSALRDASACMTVVSAVRVEHFSLDAHRRIFAAIVELANAGQHVDTSTVDDLLRRRNHHEQIGGLEYLAALTDGVVPEGTNYHLARLLENAKRRALVQACELAIHRAENSADSSTLFAGIGDALLSLEADSSRSAAQPMIEVMQATESQLEVQAAHHGLVGLPTGLDSLDQITGGIRSGQLWVTGSLPGRGKSALAVQIACANAVSGNAVEIFSLEMSREEIGKRFLAAQSEFSAARLHTPNCIGQAEWVRLLESMAVIGKYPIHIDESGTLTAQELLARARLGIRQRGAKLIIVDYLRLVDAPGRELRDRVGYVADALRQLAKSEKVGVVLLSQLRRPANVNDRPDMIQLKESGDIEAHAHVVVLLHMPLDEHGRIVNTETEIIVGKNRVGPLGSLPAYFDPGRLQFRVREVIAHEH